MMEDNSQQIYEVFVRDLKVSIKLGCQAGERILAQTVSLDLDFRIENKGIPETVDQTVCYLTASEIARELAASQEWELIEHYSFSLSRKFFERFPCCVECSISLSKFVVPGCAGSGVRLAFKRE